MTGLPSLPFATMHFYVLTFTLIAFWWAVLLFWFFFLFVLHAMGTAGKGIFFYEHKNCINIA